jgi:hypothetical protein
MKSISARVARSVNRVYRRHGPVLAGRYHLRVLRTPREVRNALAYVLLNARRHFWKRTREAPPVRLDEASSAPWFDGWRRAPPPVLVNGGEPPVALARTWLLSEGWRRRGTIDPAEVPGRGTIARVTPR